MIAKRILVAVLIAFGLAAICTVVVSTSSGATGIAAVQDTHLYG